MKTQKSKPEEIETIGKQKTKKRLTKVLKAVKNRNESTLKHLNSPSMWD